MTDDLTLALLAGMLATVNPCGFAMLPGYLALVVAGDEDNADASGTGRLGRAMASSALMTLGFVAVFGIFGLLSAAITSQLQRYLPAVTIVIGLVLLIMGVLLLAGKELFLLLPKLARGAPTTRITSMLGYGVAFAIASLSCTIPAFFAVTGIALSGGSFAAGVSTFVAYAVGMGLVVAVLAAAAALAHTAVASGMRRILPHVGRIGGGLLVVTGAYVGYYGLYELRLNNGTGNPSDPIVDLVATIQGAMSDWVEAIGPIPIVIALAVLAGGLVAARRRSRQPTSRDETRNDTDRA